MVTLTRELLEALRTPRGGFNRATVEALGLPWPLQIGWLSLMVGKSIPDSNYKAAVKAKDVKRHFHRGNTRRRP